MVTLLFLIDSVFIVNELKVSVKQTNKCNRAFPYKIKFKNYGSANWKIIIGYILIKKILKVDYPRGGVKGYFASR